MFKIKLILLSLLILFNLQSVNALELCSLKGDFVPWPWAQQFTSQVSGQNWMVVDQNGSPQGTMKLSKAAFFWGSDVYTIVESDLDGKNTKWGIARASTEADAPVELSFNVWDTSITPPQKDIYNIKMGYWKSSLDQITLEEETNLRNSPLGVPFTFESNSVCKSFRQRTDQVVGLVLNIETQREGGIIENKVLFGLTQDPIYTEE